MVNCEYQIEAARFVRGTNPCTEDAAVVRRAIAIVDCCRQAGEFDLAAEMLANIESTNISREPQFASEVKSLREKVAEKDLSPPVSPNSLPPLLVRGWNFAVAMASHAASGFSRCEQSDIDNRLSVCQACPQLVDQHCQLCGCACVAENQLINKLALKSSRCPIGKWGEL